jgi:hypothetical protein
MWKPMALIRPIPDRVRRRRCIVGGAAWWRDMEAALHDNDGATGWMKRCLVAATPLGATLLPAPLGGGVDILLAASLHCWSRRHWVEAPPRWVDDFLAFLRSCKKKKDPCLPLNPPTLSLGPPVLIREGPIHGGPHRLGRHFLVLDHSNPDRPTVLTLDLWSVLTRGPKGFGPNRPEPFRLHAIWLCFKFYAIWLCFKFYAIKYH